MNSPTVGGPAPALSVVHARIDSEIVLFGLPAKPLERLRLKFAFANPRFVAAQRFGRGNPKDPETIETLLEMPDGSAHVPRGAWAIVREYLAKDDFVPKVREDCRTWGHAISVQPTDAAKNFVARPHQEVGIERAIQHQQGLIILPPGAGKTLLGVGVTLRDPRTTLVIVPTGDIADQWVAVSRDFGIQAGKLGDGARDMDAELVVALVPTLIEVLATSIGETWAARFGRVITDECHHCPAATYQIVLRLLPARSRIGLSATPDREDGLTNLVHWSFGETLLHRTIQDMIHAGVLMDAPVELVETGWTWRYDGPRVEGVDPKRLAALERDLVDAIDRNATIVDRIALEAQNGETCLVLVRQKEHVKVLAAMLTARGVSAVGLTSAVGKKKRKAAIESIRAGTLSVIVATSLGDEGLDLPRLSVLAIAGQQRARAATTQRLGRLLRVFPKKPKVLDFVDSKIPTLARRGRDRRTVYRAAGLHILDEDEKGRQR